MSRYLPLKSKKTSSLKLLVRCKCGKLFSTDYDLEYLCPECKAVKVVV
jgi:Zn finger protein HypA/HybF involved in hydrogenase expression